MEKFLHPGIDPGVEDVASPAPYIFDQREIPARSRIRVYAEGTVAVSQLRGFLPWIVFSVVSGLAWQWAALVALAVGVVFLVKDRRAGAAAEAQILEFGTIAYFGALTAVAFADPHSPLRDYASGLSSAWLALIAASTLLVRRPFVLGIAKRRTRRRFGALRSSAAPAPCSPAPGRSVLCSARWPLLPVRPPVPGRCPASSSRSSASACRRRSPAPMSGGSATVLAAPARRR